MTSDDEKPPTSDEPGAASQPEGPGPVTLEDRTEPGGQGSPGTNQGKTEPVSRDAELPDLSSMNVGSADPQAPGRGGDVGPAEDVEPAQAGNGHTGPAPGPGDGAAPGTSEQQPVVRGRRQPEE